MTIITPEILRQEKEKSLESLGAAGQLVDLFARTISYLRVSLTDQCNLRCMYCTPMEIGEKLPCSELLRYEELLRVIELAVELGIRKVRLTGGEPLVRKNVISFIKRLAAIPDLQDIRLTTNGVMLVKYAEDLFAAGIRKLNISLDTLQRERFRKITGVDCFDQVRARSVQPAHHEHILFAERQKIGGQIPEVRVWQPVGQGMRLQYQTEFGVHRGPHVMNFGLIGDLVFYVGKRPAQTIQH